jgi:hypothetical protein
MIYSIFVFKSPSWIHYHPFILSFLYNDIIIILVLHDYFGGWGGEGAKSLHYTILIFDVMIMVSNVSQCKVLYIKETHYTLQKKGGERHS